MTRYSWLVTIILVMCMGCNDSQDIYTIDQTMQLEVTYGNQPVDSLLPLTNGGTRVTLKVTLSATTDEKFRKISFKTSAGSFEVSEAEKMEKTVVAQFQEIDGSTVLVATADLDLFSGLSDGKFFVSAEVVEKPGHKLESFFQTAPLSVKEILEIKFDSTAKRVDGATDLLVRVFLKNTGFPIRNLAFSTTEGVLLNTGDKKEAVFEVGPVGTGSEKGIEVPVRLGMEVKEYLFTAKYEGLPVSVSEPFTPARAYPDKLIVEPASFVVDTTGKPTDVYVYLKRTKGKVSIGTRLEKVSAFQLDENGKKHEFGFLSGVHNGSDAEGKILFRFSTLSPPLLKNKPVTISVMSRKDNSDKNESTWVSGSAEIWVK